MREKKPRHNAEESMQKHTWKKGQPIQQKNMIVEVQETVDRNISGITTPKVILQLLIWSETRQFSPTWLTIKPIRIRHNLLFKVILGKLKLCHVMSNHLSPILFRPTYTSRVTIICNLPHLCTGASIHLFFTCMNHLIVAFPHFVLHTTWSNHVVELA